ncbi:hypothetical protein VTP21DRAFT_9065 [Calcarisporiella thermophila]
MTEWKAIYSMPHEVYQ